MSTENNEFSGYQQLSLSPDYEAPLLPSRVKLIDTQAFVSVALNEMILPGDERTHAIQLNKRANLLDRRTAHAYYFTVLHALNGRRKVSTCTRWINEFDLFLRTIEPRTSAPIASITLAMFVWYSSAKKPSQQKLLRSFLIYWISRRQPGISQDLTDYLRASSPPKPRGSIEIQNQEPRERPFSVGETAQILSRIDELYISGEFDVQDNLLWRLTICEGLRPTQLKLQRFGDIKFPESLSVGPVTLDVPCIKQKGKAGRDHMIETYMTPSVASAIREHVRNVETLLGKPPPDSLPLFCVTKLDGKQVVKMPGISVQHKITSTRRLLADRGLGQVDKDFFTRRFRHTKLTHFAMLGAPLEVLARAGFQTSTVSLRRYVNLTEEAFVDYENRLADDHALVLDAFRGSIIEAANARHPDFDHAIFDPDLSETVGSCGGNPCDVFAPVGCYLCPRFEAFSDGSHVSVLRFLENRRALAQEMRLSKDSIERDELLIGAVKKVIKLIAVMK